MAGSVRGAAFNLDQLNDQRINRFKIKLDFC